MGGVQQTNSSLVGWKFYSNDYKSNNEIIFKAYSKIGISLQLKPR